MLANTPGGERIVAPTVDGRVCELNFDGRSSLRALPLGARRASAFCLVDFDGKNRPHYIVQAENVILAFRQSGRGIELDFSIDLDQPADSLFAVTLPGRQAEGLGTLHRRLRQIRLHDRQGRLFAGFPLAGDTGFRIEDLHGDDRRVVVVAHRETLYAYELP
jgi:phage protein U